MNKNLQNGFILGATLQGETEAYLPSGENIGDLLVWNGTEWEAKKITWTGTQAEYDALTTFDDNTDYRIIEE